MIAGIDGPVVVLSAHTAFVLEKKFDLRRLRVAARGRNEALAQELQDLRRAAMAFDPTGSAVPELELDFGADTGPSDRWMSPGVVADLLGLTDRGVRKACAEGRLEAEQDHRSRWLISQSAVEEFARTRDAAAGDSHGTS